MGENALIRAITFKKDYRVFSQGKQLTFHPGVNLLVGDQGCSKSTLLDLLGEFGANKTKAKSSQEIATLDLSQACQVFSYDYEKDNLRTKSYLDGDPRIQLSARFSSHGETVRAMNEVFSQKLLEAEPAVLLLDEPDMALSPRSAYILAERLEQLAAAGHQIFAAVHNPLVIQSQSLVLSLEHKRWMKPQTFLDKHKVL